MTNTTAGADEMPMDLPGTHWHFAASTLRDGSPLPERGTTLRDPRGADGLPSSIEPCVRGYHASERMTDALHYAPGCMLARVTLLGERKEHDNPPDKAVAEARRNETEYIDVHDVLTAWARRCAEDVAQLSRAGPISEAAAAAAAAYHAGAARIRAAQHYDHWLSEMLSPLFAEPK